MSMEPVLMRTSKEDIYLKVYRGHFATGHSHINYFIDVTQQKFSLTEARKVARELAKEFRVHTLVDTILCLDGTEVIGACMASELTRSGYLSVNQNRELYVVTPERAAGSQLIFRENTAPMITGKNVLVLMASVVTGFTAKSATETIAYYGGRTVGIASIFATVKEVGAHPVTSLFDPNDLPGYSTHDVVDCPACKAGLKLDAIVNTFGFSQL